MSEFRLPHRSDYPAVAGEKWDFCHLCGSKQVRALVHFDSGSVAPTEGETITGATSGDTMVSARYVLISGTFAGGDAIGILEGTSPTGYDDVNLEIFQNDEALNGSTSGDDFATVNKKGAIQISGRMVADSNLVEYQGKKYCRAHFRFKFKTDFYEDMKVDPGEGDRE